MSEGVRECPSNLSNIFFWSECSCYVCMCMYVCVCVCRVVQAILAIPVMYGYAAIVFSDPIYRSFMPSLAKLMLFSSIVHSISFCVLSTIPFAIGLVQDAGLIFLSKIATDIAMRMDGESPEAIVATSLVVIAVGTAALGLVLVLIGRAKLAKFVSFLPMPVIGGYLGFIGFFCVEAGLSLASGKVVNGMDTWHNIMNDRSVVLWYV
jgi:SulP family sulfate permease